MAAVKSSDKVDWPVEKRELCRSGTPHDHTPPEVMQVRKFLADRDRFLHLLIDALDDVFGSAVPSRAAWFETLGVAIERVTPSFALSDAGGSQ